jgi:hypothetical protein
MELLNIPILPVSQDELNVQEELIAWPRHPEDDRYDTVSKDVGKSPLV